MAVEKWKREVGRQWRYFCCFFFSLSPIVVCGCGWWGDGGGGCCYCVGFYCGSGLLRVFVDCGG